jgi:putative acetyltransferase
MISIIKTNHLNEDFIILVRLLDKELAERDGEEHAFYSQFNKIDLLKHAIVVFENDIPVGCGAIKEFSPGTMEVKRMFVQPLYRGKGIASIVLNELENWATELGYTRCVLETGYKQPEAIALYKIYHHSKLWAVFKCSQ